jgi:hypothetical protein
MGCASYKQVTPSGVNRLEHEPNLIESLAYSPRIIYVRSQP